MNHPGTEWTPVDDVYRRRLSDSELAFFPAAQNGLGDMFLHISLRTPEGAWDPAKIIAAWATLRFQHPLLVANVHYDPDNVDNSYFEFKPPKNALECQDRSNVHFKHSTKDAMIDEYMNGKRVLSNTYMSYLVVSKLNEPPSAMVGHDEYDVLMCAPHYAGDGTALHLCMQELLVLMASHKSPEELREESDKELQGSLDWLTRLPPACEARLSVPGGSWFKTAAKVNFIQTREKEIGGHVLPRSQCAAQKTVLIETSFTEAETKKLLARCKANGVTVNHALSVLCNVAWAKCITDPESTKLPMMLYTAINLRPHLSPHPSQTYWFLALTYYTLVLPSFPPSSSSVFWHRARQVKVQTRRTVQPPFLVARALAMAKTRADRTRGVTAESLPSLSKLEHGKEANTPPAPSSALLGLSLIGNLDTIYNRSAYLHTTLHTVTTASRQKAGGLLLLEHTFAGKLWLHLCWDVNGFGEDGVVERFWEGLQAAVRNFLIDGN